MSSRITVCLPNGNKLNLSVSPTITMSALIKYAISTKEYLHLENSNLAIMYKIGKKEFYPKSDECLRFLNLSPNVTLFIISINSNNELKSFCNEKIPKPIEDQNQNNTANAAVDCTNTDENSLNIIQSEDFKGTNDPSYSVFIRNHSSNANNELNDSDFELSHEELKLALDSQKKRNEALLNAPLKTSAMRKMEMKATPTETLIRVWFPRTEITLQKAFNTHNDSLQSVKKWLTDSILKDGCNHDFKLVFPLAKKKTMIESESLFASELCPTALLHFKGQENLRVEVIKAAKEETHKKKIGEAESSTTAAPDTTKKQKNIDKLFRKIFNKK